MPRKPSLSTIRQRAAAARKTYSGGRNGGRPPEADRCRCGCGLTMERARKRHPLRAVPA